MRQVLGGTVLAVSILLAGQVSAQRTAEHLFTVCSSGSRVEQAKTPLEVMEFSVAFANCAGYIDGFIEGYKHHQNMLTRLFSPAEGEIFARSLDSIAPRICLPDSGIRVERAIEIYLAYYSLYRERHAETTARTELMLALATVYQCSRGAEEP